MAKRPVVPGAAARVVRAPALARVQLDATTNVQAVFGQPPKAFLERQCLQGGPRLGAVGSPRAFVTLARIAVALAVEAGRANTLSSVGRGLRIGRARVATDAPFVVGDAVHTRLA